MLQAIDLIHKSDHTSANQVPILRADFQATYNIEGIEVQSQEVQQITVQQIEVWQIKEKKKELQKSSSPPLMGEKNSNSNHFYPNLTQQLKISKAFSYHASESSSNLDDLWCHPTFLVSMHEGNCSSNSTPGRRQITSY
ncbi:hypothetical protein Droror1_Dr00016311 [Drosera rotundifolia]